MHSYSGLSLASVRQERNHSVVPQFTMSSINDISINDPSAMVSHVPINDMFTTSCDRQFQPIGALVNGLNRPHPISYNVLWAFSAQEALF
jgi:hypothetical protein